jgi:glycosyltransferase involved in cell wall biosynthesis
VATATPTAVTAIIPCLDEEAAIGPVVNAIARYALREIIVVDVGSQDRTVERARAAGAKVVIEPRRGYGRAMRACIGAASLESSILLFLDGDGSDRTEMIADVLAPIERDTADFVMGSRIQGQREPGSLAAAQIAAGFLAGQLIRARYGVRFTDMSPFRAIRRSVFDHLGMREETFGWNLEMQMRVAAAGLRVVEIPVGQRLRVGGRSKVSGNWPATARAVWVLVSTFLRLALTLKTARASDPLRQRQRHDKAIGCGGDDKLTER